MSDPSWYSPICDSVLRKIYRWYVNYHRGDVSATRPWMSLEGRVVDKVTKHANHIRFTEREVDHLIRIMDALAPTRALVDFYRQVRKGLRKGKFLPGGEYEIVLNAYKQDAEETLQTLIRAKTGKLKTIDDIAKEQVSEGKSPFEV